MEETDLDSFRPFGFDIAAFDPSLHIFEDYWSTPTVDEDAAAVQLVIYPNETYFVEVR
jgi:hypothetical protein